MFKQVMAVFGNARGGADDSLSCDDERFTIIPDKFGGLLRKSS